KLAINSIDHRRIGRLSSAFECPHVATVTGARMSIVQSVRRQTLIKVASRLSGLLMAASLASAMTSAVTSATTSSVASVATADDLGWNHFGGPVLYVPFGWMTAPRSTMNGAALITILRARMVSRAGSKPASTGRTEALSMAAKPT